MEAKKKRKYTKAPKGIKIRAVMRGQVDARKIARAVVELAEQNAKNQAEQVKTDKAA
jgi:hypothetical protein